MSIRSDETRDPDVSVMHHPDVTNKLLIYLYYFRSRHLQVPSFVSKDRTSQSLPKPLFDWEFLVLFSSVDHFLVSSRKVRTVSVYVHVSPYFGVLPEVPPTTLTTPTCPFDPGLGLSDDTNPNPW